jgi:hypothetical protein
MGALRYRMNYRLFGLSIWQSYKHRCATQNRSKQDSRTSLLCVHIFVLGASPLLLSFVIFPQDISSPLLSSSASVLAVNRRNIISEFAVHQ